MAENRREYYQFIFSNALKGFIWLAAIIGVYFLADHYLPDEWNEYLGGFKDRPVLITLIFFLSETFIGLIPLEFFILLVRDSSTIFYVSYVSLLSALSYLGALIAFGAGKYTHRIPWLKKLTQLKSFEKYSNMYRKWGGVIIILAALTPLPFATISFLSASFQFPLKKYLLFAATRFIRFAVVALLIKLGINLF